MVMEGTRRKLPTVRRQLENVQGKIGKLVCAIPI